MEEKVITGAPAAQEKESRESKRLKEIKRDFLQLCVREFMEERSRLLYSDGLEAEALFMKYRQKWQNECTKFNSKPRRPFDMRYTAFAEEIDRLLKIEEAGKVKVRKDFEDRQFNTWLRREKIWKFKRSLGFKQKILYYAIWFFIKSQFGYKSEIEFWRDYYNTNILTHA